MMWWIFVEIFVLLHSCCPFLSLFSCQLCLNFSQMVLQMKLNFTSSQGTTETNGFSYTCAWRSWAPVGLLLKWLLAFEQVPFLLGPQVLLVCERRESRCQSTRVWEEAKTWGLVASTVSFFFFSRMWHVLKMNKSSPWVVIKSFFLFLQSVVFHYTPTLYRGLRSCPYPWWFIYSTETLALCWSWPFIMNHRDLDIGMKLNIFWNYPFSTY